MSSNNKKIKSGWLTKKGHFIKNWKKRYVVLWRGKLVYYTTSLMDDTRGEFLFEQKHIDDISVQNYSDTSSKAYRFALENKATNAFLELCASSSIEKKEWIEEIEKLLKSIMTRKEGVNQKPIMNETIATNAIVESSAIEDNEDNETETNINELLKSIVIQKEVVNQKTIMANETTTTNAIVVDQPIVDNEDNEPETTTEKKEDDEKEKNENITVSPSSMKLQATAPEWKPNVSAPVFVPRAATNLPNNVSYTPMNPQMNGMGLNYPDGMQGCHQEMGYMIPMVGPNQEPQNDHMLMAPAGVGPHIFDLHSCVPRIDVAPQLQPHVKTEIVQTPVSPKQIKE